MVLDHERRAQALSPLGGHDARHQVERDAGRKTDKNPDWPIGECLRGDRWCEQARDYCHDKFGPNSHANPLLHMPFPSSETTEEPARTSSETTLRWVQGGSRQ